MHYIYIVLNDAINVLKML